MPQDAVELVPYLRHVEQLFTDFNVESELRAHLLKPHLSDQAPVLIARMDPVKASSYDEIKKLLLSEFKLSSAALLEKYNSLKRSIGETYTLYGNRIKSVLMYYVESRKAMGYEMLLELLVCDRLKSHFSPAAMQHILSQENQASKGWLRLDDLVTALDRFYATYNDSDQPRIVNDAVPNQVISSYNVSNRTSMQSYNSRIPPPRPPPPKFGGNKRIAVTRTQSEREKNNDRRCFICGSRFHLQSYHKRVRTNSHEVQVKSCVMQSSAGSRVDTGVQYDANNNIPEQATKSVSASTGAGQMPTNINELVIQPANPCSDRLVDQSDRPIAELVENDFSVLQYLSVCLTDGDSVVRTSGLVNSGAEINLVKAKLVKDLNAHVMKSVRLRGVIGQAIDADLIRLNVKLDNNEERIQSCGIRGCNGSE